MASFFTVFDLESVFFADFITATASSFGSIDDDVFEGDFKGALLIESTELEVDDFFDSTDDFVDDLSGVDVVAVVGLLLVLRGLPLAGAGVAVGDFEVPPLRGTPGDLFAFLGGLGEFDGLIELINSLAATLA